MIETRTQPYTVHFNSTECSITNPVRARNGESLKMFVTLIKRKIDAMDNPSNLGSAGRPSRCTADCGAAETESTPWARDTCPSRETHRASTCLPSCFPASSPFAATSPVHSGTTPGDKEDTVSICISL